MSKNLRILLALQDYLKKMNITKPFDIFVSHKCAK